MKNVKFIYYFTIVLCCYFQKSNAQDPNWYVNAFDYQYNMTFTAFLNVNGATLSSSNDKVAAFVGNEVRGVSTVVFEPNYGKYLVFLSVYSNTSNETITFKIYNSSTDSVIETSQTHSFSINANVGEAFQSYSIANPLLNNQAIFNSFSFSGVNIINSDILSNSINIEVPQGTDLSTLTPIFSTSLNARVYIGNTEQTSSLTSNDFQNPISYRVLSEDESVLNEYLITVSLSTSSGSSDNVTSGSGVLSSVTEGINTGIRLSTSNDQNHGNIGSNALDLSYQTTPSTTTGATGEFSIALGNNTTSSGYVSTVTGLGSTASGGASTAMGIYTNATGDFSTAMGNRTTASGNSSTALGGNTIASDYASLVIGQYNASGSSATSANSFSTVAPAFVIGNGTFGANSDAFKVLFNGNTYVSNSLHLGGIEITSTATELNLLSGATSLGTGILSPVTENSNTGVRLSTANAANHGDIGKNAVDLSYSNSASSTRGATGTQATSMGYETTASGSLSTAMGGFTTASATQSTSMGGNTTASGTYATSMGGFTTASGYSSTAMGANTTASGSMSTAMGRNTTASTTYSTAMGYYTTASDYASLVIGQYNLSGSSATSADSFSIAAPAFVIGNGEDSDNKSDAFKVLFNGDTAVSNDLMVGGDVEVSSDARLKANIISLGATLSKLLLIDGKSYTMKKNGKQKIGVLAQDIQKVFPELVGTDDNDMLTVNYQGLVPVLINALKEQEKKFKDQEDKIKEQEKRLDKLEKLVDQLD